MQGKIADLEKMVYTLQKEIVRLTALVKKFPPKRKSSGKQQESQP